jgi:hypothetical protein
VRVARPARPQVQRQQPRRPVDVSSKAHIEMWLAIAETFTET